MILKIIFWLLLCAKFVYASDFSRSSGSVHDEEAKSSLVFVFDTTGSMYDDLKQLIEGAEMILDTAMEDSNVISNFVFVPFHDPVVGPVTVTQDKEVFKSALKVIRVRGGGDCPEKSLGGIKMALNVSHPGSFIYVFTDATAGDHRLVEDVLDAVQLKQSQVVFVLTGHCNDLDRPHYKVYQRIAAASSGQVFNLNKTSVHNVLDFVRSSIKGRTVNLGTVVNPPGYNHTREIPIDSSVAEVTVSVSGAKPQIHVFDPRGEALTGPPRLVTTLDLSEIMVVKVMQPEAGNWTITVGSEDNHSVKVVGLSNLTFHHGFSVQKPTLMSDTTLRPLQGTLNYMMIELTQGDIGVDIKYAEILNLEGRTLFEVPLQSKGHRMYLAEAFLPPVDFFYIAINGRDQSGQELRRVGATAIQAKPPDRPYLEVIPKIETSVHKEVKLTCRITSQVPVKAMWTKDFRHIQPEITSLQSTIVEYVIADVNEATAGRYKCVAGNEAGYSDAFTDVVLQINLPRVNATPKYEAALVGSRVNIACSAFSETKLLSFQLLRNHSELYADIPLDELSDGYYTYNTHITVGGTNENYSCRAVNKRGEAIDSASIISLKHPRATIKGPHRLRQRMLTHLELVCELSNANEARWISPNGTVFVNERKFLNVFVLTINSLMDSDEGNWTCVASVAKFQERDTIMLELFLDPKVKFEGDKHLMLFYGMDYNLTCTILAKPRPIVLITHNSADNVVSNSSVKIAKNTYKISHPLYNVTKSVEGRYNCSAENTEGVSLDSVMITVRKNMSLLEGLTDMYAELNSQVELYCKVESYPAPQIQWYHNGTEMTVGNRIVISADKDAVFIQKLDLVDAGPYSCVAKNKYESIAANGSLTIVGLETPLLSKEPAKIITQRGNTTVVSCRLLKGNPEPRISWRYKNETSREFTELPKDVVLNENSSMLTMSNAQYAGVYQCMAENVLGSDVYNCDLVVQAPPQLIDEIDEVSDHNKPLEVKAGESIRLSCKAIGNPPPIVFWTKDKAPVPYTKNVYLTDDNELHMENVTEYNSGTFTCTAKSSLGYVQRNFTLIVYEVPTIFNPPMDPELEVIEGDLVELPCFSRGVPRPTLQWLQNGQAIETGRRKYIDQDYTLRFVANLTDFGEYTCVATNHYGNTSYTFSVFIWVPPYIEPPLQVTVEGIAGTNITMQCNAVGFPIPTILWEYEHKLLTQNTTELSFNNVGDVYVNNANSTHDGLYLCVAENVAGVASKAIRLNINEPPQILVDDHDGPYLGTNMDVILTIACRATGKPKPFIVWSKDGYFLDKDSQYVIDADGSLIINHPSEDMSGAYVCHAKNTVGQTNKTVEVDIYPLPTQPQSDEGAATVDVLEGTNLTLLCPASLSHKDSVKWYKDGLLVGSGELRLVNISRHNASRFECVVRNAVRWAWRSVRVRVAWQPQGVRGDTGERGASDRRERVAGDDESFRCDVDAFPEPEIKWLFNSKLLFGENKPVLRILNLKLHHSGVYKCVAKNVYGSFSRQFVLDVLEPPYISDFDFLDVQLLEGSNATLSCDAKGSPTPTVKWTFNNTNWKENSSLLHCRNTTAASQGIFRCDATNKAGKTHTVYRVAVVSAARVRYIVIYDGSNGVNVGKHIEVLLNTTVRVACYASGNPEPRIQWQRNGVAISKNEKGIAYADLVLDMVTNNQAGLYSCITTNEVGTDERKVKVEVLESPKISTSPSQEINILSSTNLEVLSGQPFYLRCHPYGNPVPEIYWFKDDIPFRIFDDKMSSADFGEIIESRNALYEQSGNYTCVARNKIGERTFSYLVDVLVPPPQPKEPSTSTRVTRGKDLLLSCPVYSEPAPSVTWFKQPFTEISEKLPRVTLSDNNVTLTLSNTVTADSGTYLCIMTNKVGASEIQYIVSVETPPTINGTVKYNVTSDHSVVLNCATDGEPKPNVTWYKDTKPLYPSTESQFSVSNSVYTIWRTRALDAGQYVCVAENSAGVGYKRFHIYVTVEGKWSEWSSWSLCNVTCGPGHQGRSRRCYWGSESKPGRADPRAASSYVLLAGCDGSAKHYRKCHMPPCEDTTPQPWSSWSKWSTCSSTCGSGTQTRTRRCRTARCRGDNMQIRKCMGLPRCWTELSDLNPLIPEATFELQPHIVNNEDEVEEFYEVTANLPKVFEVELTQNLDNIDSGSCGVGFRFNATTGVCEDINECLISTNQCHSTQMCENSPGGYRCSCQPGFVAMGAGQRCLDVNECELQTAQCEFACVNVAGGYVCACPRQWRLHADRRRCVRASQERVGDYFDTDVEYLAKYNEGNRY